jgi:hypothetical protein
MSEELDILVKLQGRFYEGKIRLQKVGQSVPPQRASAPIFPEPYSEMLALSDQGDHWQIKPRSFLNSSDFAEILRLVKQYGGEYVSAGRSSHFRVPK